MARQVQTLRVADLVRSKIMTADGTMLGRVVDVEACAGGDYRVTGLLYGRAAWLYRWHVLGPLVSRLGLRLAPCLVRWEDVEEFTRYTIRLKPGAQPEEIPLERLEHGGGWQGGGWQGGGWQGGGWQGGGA